MLRLIIKLRILLGLLVLLGLGGFGSWYLYSADSRSTSYRTVQVERGDLLATISSTGTIEPEEVIDVGAQVQGQIISFGQDPRGHKLIDFGSPVEGPKKGWFDLEGGTVLARIDTKVYKAQVDRAAAQVKRAEAQIDTAKGQIRSAEALFAVAMANVKRAEADLGQMRAKLVQSERDYRRCQALLPTRAVNQQDCDLAQANYESAAATLEVGQATIAQTKASLLDAEANIIKSKAALKDMEAYLLDMQAALENAEINLGYCTIRSPVNGVIIDRRVNIGQTVVSSLNAPSLFLIAKDLKRMQIWASVNEADIGSIHEGQEATFTVDAFPKRVFKGTVAADNPRLNASMTNNVVIYTVVVNTDNSDGVLKPYLTANLRFQVSKRNQVLMVPNAALRWKPSPMNVIPEARADFIRSQQRKKGTPSDGPNSAEKESHERGTLWIAEGKFVRPIKVQVGLTDGLMTEIDSAEFQEGAQVVVGESRSGGASGAKNPFAPKMFGK